MSEGVKPDQDKVDRKFCQRCCCAWRGEVCGTVWAPEDRKGKCLWSLDEIKKKKGGW